MADLIEIVVGGEKIKVPRWATEETAKEMAKYNLASAKALTELVRQTKKGKDVFDSNINLLAKSSKETAKNQTEQNKAIKVAKTATEKYGDVVKNTSDRISSAGKRFLDAFNNNSLSGMTNAIVGIGAIGAAGALAAGTVGFAMAQLETYTQHITNLTNVGVGLGISLVDLRNQAAATAMSMENYSNLVASHGAALRSIGNNAQDGARRFSELSRDLRHLARDFNNFGLTNQEFNEILAQEIELRRLSGMTQAQITADLATSMNRLLTETTAMAVITGQDRREIMVRRQAMARNEALMAANMAAVAQGGDDLSDTFTAMSGAFAPGDDLGAQLSTAIMTAVLQNRDFRAVADPSIVQMAALDSEFGAALTGIQEFVRANYTTMNPDVLAANVLTRLADATQNSFTSDELARLGLLSNTDDGARNLINFISSFSGLSTNLQENLQAMRDTPALIEETALIGTASALEELTTNIKASGITTMFNVISDVGTRAGINMQDFDNALLETINNISDNYGVNTGIVEGTAATFGDLTSNMSYFEQALIAATIALGGLALAAGTFGLTGGLMNRLRGAGRAGVGASAAGITSRANGLRSIAGRITLPLTAMFGGGMGYYDEELQASGMNNSERIRTGIGETFLGAFDWAANTTNSLLGLSDVLGEANLAGSFREIMIENERAINAAIEARNAADLAARPAAFSPATDPNHYRPDSLNGIIQGATWGSRSGEVNTNIDPSVAWRHRDNDTIIERRLLQDLIAEVRRMRRAFEE